MKILPLIRLANYYETDRMGIIHHSNYIRWFEEARVDYLGKIGMPYSEVEEMGVMMPVLEVSCEYKSPVHFNDTVVILSKIKEFKGAKITISYEVYDQKTRELRTKGETKHCFVHADTFQPLRLRTDYPEMNERIMELVGIDIVDWE
ncbi:acyl-CoA thioesterase [Anaerovorax sp. IOR16]|uniref:acyl-CoA thioesterase n=1 Tax=Anaerovorax sp. IOR16 TaxID=2773458 RepID=UPI001FD66A80|nr:thioesterase family protein [Anaerovorax sp. IOR16]